MQWKRVLKHVMTFDADLNEPFSELSLAVIKSAIEAASTKHSGKIQFVVEASLPTAKALRGISSRERALELFSQQRMWDTANNNGVLIYMLLADHALDVVSDRGIHERVPAESWNRIIDVMQEHFAIGRFEAGVVTGIELVAQQLAVHFPPSLDASASRVVTTEAYAGQNEESQLNRFVKTAAFG